MERDAEPTGLPSCWVKMRWSSLQKNGSNKPPTLGIFATLSIKMIHFFCLEPLKQKYNFHSVLVWGGEFLTMASSPFRKYRDSSTTQHLDHGFLMSAMAHVGHRPEEMENWLTEAQNVKRTIGCDVT